MPRAFFLLVVLACAACGNTVVTPPGTGGASGTGGAPGTGGSTGFSCAGVAVCSATELCYHPCGCGGPIETEPPDDAGVCPPNTNPIPGNPMECVVQCTADTTPYCVPASDSECQGAATGHDCYPPCPL